MNILKIIVVTFKESVHLEVYRISETRMRNFRRYECTYIMGLQIPNKLTAECIVKSLKDYCYVR